MKNKAPDSIQTDMKKHFALFAWLLVAQVVYAQPSFRKTIGGPGADLARAVIQLPDGGYLVAGSTQLIPSGQDDALLIRLNAQGDVLWQHSYGSDVGNEVFTDCCIGNDGGFLCLGQTTSYGAGGLDVWFVKVDDNGAIQWSNTYGSATNDQSSYLVPVPPDRYVTAANTTNGSGTQFDAFALSINNTGVKQWSRSYSNGTDNLTILWADPASATIWAGGIQFNTLGSFDGLLMSIHASTGVPIQARTYGLGSLYFNFPTPDGDLFAADGSALPGSSERWAWAIKVDPLTGTPKWSYLYGIPGQNYRSRAIPALDGGFALTLIDPTLNPAHTATDAIVARIDLDGQLLWSFDYGGSGPDRLLDIQPTRDSGFVFCGTYYYQDATKQDILLVKTDRNGQVNNCCLAPITLTRVTKPATPTSLTSPTLPWTSPVEQNPTVSTSTMGAKPLACFDEGPIFDLIIQQPGCDKEKGGEIQVVTTCNCQFSLNDGPVQTELIFSNLDTGTYKISARSELGCRHDTLISLKIAQDAAFVKIPNAFTPNGDAVNERFRPAAAPNCPVTVHFLQVYNRWGQRVFEQLDFSTANATAGWDGLLDGDPAPAEVYAYIIEYTSVDGQVHQEKGNVTLLR